MLLPLCYNDSMKAMSKKGIRCARIVALALFCVGAITVATLPLWRAHLPSFRASSVTVDPFCAVDLTAKFGTADYFVVSGPDGEQSYTAGELATFSVSGEYLIRAVSTQDDGILVKKHSLTVRKDTAAPSVRLTCTQVDVTLGMGLFVTTDAQDNFTPTALLDCTLTAQNATVTQCAGGYLVFPDSVGVVDLTFSASDYAHNSATQSLTLTCLPPEQKLILITTGTVAYDTHSVFLVGTARTSLVSALSVGTYELTITGGTVTLWTAELGAMAYTQKRLLVEVTEQGAYVNGDWVNGLVYLTMEGEDVSLTSSRPLF